MVETSPFFFVKLFFIAGLLFGFLMVGMYGFIAFCSAGIMAKKIEDGKEKITGDARRKIKREIMTEAKFEKHALSNTLNDKHEKDLKRIEKRHVAEIAALEKKLENKTDTE